MLAVNRLAVDSSMCNALIHSLEVSDLPCCTWMGIYMEFIWKTCSFQEDLTCKCCLQIWICRSAWGLKTRSWECDFKAEDRFFWGEIEFTATFLIVAEAFYFLLMTCRGKKKEEELKPVEALWLFSVSGRKSQSPVICLFYSSTDAKGMFIPYRQAQLSLWCVT